MALCVIYQQGDFAQTDGWTQVLRAAGHVVINAAAGQVPPTQKPDVGIYLSSFTLTTGLANYYAQGNSVITASQAPWGGQIAPLNGPGAAVVATGDSIASTDAANLGAGWTGQPLAQVFGTHNYGIVQLPTGAQPGAQVLGTLSGPGIAPNTPGYVLLASPTRFWLHLHSSAAPDAALVADVAAYLTSRFSGSTACTTDANCPTGSICQSGVCVSSTTPPPILGGDCKIFGLPCWLAALLGLGAVYLVSEDGKHGRGGGIRTRTIVRHEHHRETASEASRVLLRRRQQLNR